MSIPRGFAEIAAVLAHSVDLAMRRTAPQRSISGHPNGHGAAVYDLPLVKQIASAHNVSGAQVGLKWIVQQGHTFVTASGESAYDVEDLDLWSFTLNATEMAALSAFTESGKCFVA